VGLFDTEMYVSKLHGGPCGSKTSSFKRCVFLKNIGERSVTDRLLGALRTRPSPLCYIHLVQGGGAVGDIASDDTAFGCRDWDFACVITGVWPRDQDNTEVSRSAIQWVYSVAGDLLSLKHCGGAYSADLGPDPRSAVLAAKAFGPNDSRLVQLKRTLDPRNVLAYTCPLPLNTLPRRPQLILLVTGKNCAGKDYCADVWASYFISHGLTARKVSISDEYKREYAAATGADLDLLLVDRHYKEQHRSALTDYYQDQVRRQRKLPELNFQSVVGSAADVDVLLITGMRDEAPVAIFSHLVHNSRLIEVHVEASKQTRRIRRGDDVDGQGDSNTYFDND